MRFGVAAVAAALALAGCANEPLGGSAGGPVAYLGASSLGTDGPEQAAVETVPAVKKSVASKVLSAMAFEKVTGLKADPARLLETD